MRPTSLSTHLYISGELVVAEYVDWCKLSNFIELEFDLDRLSIPSIVPPANPTLTWNRGGLI
jgi:hypothetical protein